LSSRGDELNYNGYFAKKNEILQLNQFIAILVVKQQKNNILKFANNKI